MSSPSSTISTTISTSPSVGSLGITKKVIVTQLNIHYLTESVKTGAITCITSKDDGLRKSCHNKSLLQIGDIVERKLQDCDYIIINRQPTLHRHLPS